MWCSICRQDVPGSIVPGGGQYCCPRCGEMMPSSNGRIAEPTAEKTESAESAASATPPASDYDEWEMEERLRHLDRIYARSPLRSPLTASGSHHIRIDSQHAPVPREQAPPAPTPKPSSSWVTRLGQFSLGLGLAVTVCGGCLMAWSHYGARPDLMPIGIPIAVVGQLFLLISFVLQLDSPTTAPTSPTKTAPPSPALPPANSNLRIDPAPDSSPQLSDLAARLDELSRKLEERDDQPRK